MKKLLIMAFIVVLLVMSALAISYKSNQWSKLSDAVIAETAKFKEEKTNPVIRQNIVDVPKMHQGLEILPKQDGFRPPIARFMDQDIYAEQFFLSGHKVTDEEYSSRALYAKLRIFLGKLTAADFEKAHNIVVMEGDIDDYLSYRKRILPAEEKEVDQEAAKKLSDQMNKRVAGIRYLQKKFSEEKDETLRKELYVSIEEQKKQLMGEQFIYMKHYSDSTTAMNREAVRANVAQVIQDWKRHAALYEVFGGKVICLPFGCQAVEAYQKLVLDYMKTGGVEILMKDPAEAKAHSHGHDGHVHYHDKKEAEKAKEHAEKQQENKEIKDSLVVSDERAKFYFETPIWQRSEAELTEMSFEKLTR